MGSSLSSDAFRTKYHLQKVKLGEGSFGIVWRGRDVTQNRDVAVKQMDKAACQRKGLQNTDIEREMAMLKAFDHANITRLYDTHEDRDCFYMVLEYCDEADFGDKILERGTDISEGELAHWMRQALAAVAEVHAKLVAHRDIKPDNFMVSKHCLKLTDFGLAVHVPQGTLLKEKCGTPAFMAPEVHAMPKSRGYTFGVDDWALGLMMFMLMTGGKHPFFIKKQLDLRKLLTGKLVWPTGSFFCAAKYQYSPRAQQLCQKLTTADPRKRMTCRQALNDPFMAEPSTSELIPACAGRELLSSSLASSSGRFQWMYESRQLMPGVPLPKGVGFEKLARLNIYNWSKWLTAEELKQNLSKIIKSKRYIRIHSEGSRSSEAFRSPKDAIQWLKDGCPVKQNPQPRSPKRFVDVESPTAYAEFEEDDDDEHEQPAFDDIDEAVSLAMPAVTAALAVQTNNYELDEERMWSLTESLRSDATRIPASHRLANSKSAPNLSPLQGVRAVGTQPHAQLQVQASREKNIAPTPAHAGPPPLYYTQNAAARQYRKAQTDVFPAGAAIHDQQPQHQPPEAFRVHSTPYSAAHAALGPGAFGGTSQHWGGPPVAMAAHPCYSAPAYAPAHAPPVAPAAGFPGLAAGGVYQQGAFLPAGCNPSAPGLLGQGLHGGVGQANIAAFARQNAPQAAYPVAVQMPGH